MAETGLQNPGDFKVEKANLITSAGIDIPLIPHLVSINLYEDILKNALSWKMSRENESSRKLSRDRLRSPISLTLKKRKLDWRV